MIKINRGSKKNLAYPFKFIDRIMEMDNQSCLVLKNVTVNEWCMIRDEHIGICLPPIIVTECMIQAAGLLEETRQSNKKVQIFLLSMDKVKMIAKVVPGMQLFIKAVIINYRKFQTRYMVEVKVANQSIAKGEFDFACISR